MDDEHSTPSTSSSSNHSQLIKEFNLRKFDKLVKKMGRKLLHRPCDKTFVPSATPHCPSPKGMSHSPSSGDSSNLSAERSDRRKCSEPTFGLKIETYGGEVAGSGYGWLTASDMPEPYHSVDVIASVTRAQQVALQMVKDRISMTKQQIESCRVDERLISDFIADAFAEEMKMNHSPKSYTELQEDVKKLEEEIEGLRKISLKPIPPPRPARPNQHLTWICVRCLEENTASFYRCHSCSFPRPAIDPREAVRCNCQHCTPASVERMFVSPTPGEGDWLLLYGYALGFRCLVNIIPSPTFHEFYNGITRRTLRSLVLKQILMSTVVEQLVDMGFERARAEYAFAQTGRGALETAMDWLINHEGEEIPAPSTDHHPNEEEKPGSSELTEHTPGSYKCNDCNKLFRDENSMMFHAAKSGHENFSESTQVIAPLTPEERAQKERELRDKIRAARAKKEEEEKREQIEKERRRREEGKKMLETKEKQKEMELRALVEERKREKREEELARQRVLDQIKADREARKAAKSGVQPTAPPKPAPAPSAASAPTHDYKETTIQVRLKNGQAVRQKFGASEPLSAVRLWLELNHSDGTPFNLLQPFPHKVMTFDDYEKPLKELGLVPSANFVMTPMTGVVREINFHP
ncbi:unnamed protein product [Cylicocyclus nassatus]|uniref:Uncharacterized protein n=1 Tax=Cylicocyclus nassatus TaxID=53992 RepID=A0AA36GLR1_CYLNA|nr:unnamed protein product [Cylicocyclus nassatus]